MAFSEGSVPTFCEGFHDSEACAKMTYRKLGNTGYSVSVLGFGASALGGVFHDVTEEECCAVVQQGLRSGINVVDTAPWYGQGKSEEMLGKALQGVPRKAYMLNTKVGRYEPDPTKMFDFSADRVTRSVDESLQRLRVDYIDLVQIHDLEFAPDIDIIVEQTLPALDKLRASGKVKMIGITGYPLAPLKQVVEKCPVKIDTVLSYCRQTLIDQSLHEILPYFEEKEIAVINAAPTGMGMLSRQGPPGWHPATQPMKDACKAAAAYCEEQGVDISRLALATSLMDPKLPTTLISCAKLEYMQANLKTAIEGLNSSEEACLQHIREAFFQPFGNMSWEGIEVDRYWQKVDRNQLLQSVYHRHT